jgi:hypothetical protein
VNAQAVGCWRHAGLLVMVMMMMTYAAAAKCPWRHGIHILCNLIPQVKAMMMRLG